MNLIDKTRRPIEPIFDTDKLNWMEDLMYALEVQGDMDRSDAQGYQMCRMDATDECYESGKSAEETATYLLADSYDYVSPYASDRPYFHDRPENKQE